jgi:hypothetical protein
MARPAASLGAVAAWPLSRTGPRVFGWDSPSLGASYERGGLDEDGEIDLADLAAMLGVYGTPCD